MKILLGVTGSVAAVLTFKLVAAFKEHNCDLRVIITESGEKFLNKEYNRFPTKYQDEKFGFNFANDKHEWDWNAKGDPILHIDVRNWADVFLVCPLSANTLAKAANGLADNLVTNTIRAWDYGKPMVLVPACNTKMYNHPITKKHLDILTEWGAIVIPPQEKMLACGEMGIGAIANIEDIVLKVKNL